MLQAAPTWAAPASDDDVPGIPSANPTSERIEAVGGDIWARLIDPETGGRPIAAIVILDDATPDRLEAIARYWRGLRSPPTSPDPRLTTQRRQRLRQMLRAVDARLERQTYRAIAIALFPNHKIDAASWAGDALRETTIRLARDGMKLVRGGYRDLLRRPRKS
ncbi:DUF2285 domain-containing protein [Rhizobium sp. CIAT894]|uniref:DUF2285 domain-containing protein n=1 Tax=Rhizobium sp. CIAT894 TaxID=2020312 RepID=UPI000B7896C1|nr:DUF2285 domain-containing protein [Rhizobium sp. CIAT894]